MSKYSNLQLRIVAGIIGAAIMVGSVYYNKWAYAAIFFLIVTLTLTEFYNLFRAAKFAPNYGIGLAISSFNYVGVFLYKIGILDYQIFLLNIPLVISVFIAELYRRKEKPFLNIAVTIFGVVYVSVPFILLHILVFYSNIHSEVERANGYLYYLLISLLTMMWANDTGAYTFGRLMGKHPLFKRISPKKTWEGAVGGVITTLLMAIVCGSINTEFTYIEWCILALVVSISGIYGDLFESLLKRSLNVKDSSSVIPGHGGFLDRFDGLLLISPLTIVYVEILY